MAIPVHSYDCRFVLLLLTIITEANQNTDCTLYLLHCGCSALEYSLQRYGKPLYK